MRRRRVMPRPATARRPPQKNKIYKDKAGEASKNMGGVTGFLAFYKQIERSVVAVIVNGQGGQAVQLQPGGVAA